MLAKLGTNRHRQKKSRKSKAKDASGLVISEAHSSRLVLRDTENDSENETEMSDLETHEEGGWTMPNINDPENSEGGDESGEEENDKHSEQDLEYLSGDAQVTSGNNGVRDGDVPATMEGQMTATKDHHSPVPNHVPTTPNPITSPPVDAIDNQFTVDTPETRAGRKWKTRDLHSILAVCTCGQAVSEDEILQNRDIIMCQRAGCEMGWYHLRCVRLEYSINGWICEACEASGGGQR